MYTWKNLVRTLEFFQLSPLHRPPPQFLTAPLPVDTLMFTAIYKQLTMIISYLYVYRRTPIINLIRVISEYVRPTDCASLKRVIYIRSQLLIHKVIEAIRLLNESI